MVRRVIFHVGPHKTGTTSIQRALLAGGPYGYPVPEKYGPGHALTAWRAFGLTGFQPETNLLVDSTRSLDSSDTVVFSSEEFCRVLDADATSTALERLAEEFPVELVVTLTPLPDRL